MPNRTLNIKRLLSIACLTLIGMIMGSYLGLALSYWFAPEIMRLYLSWSDYLIQLPEQLFHNDFLGMDKLIVYSALLGAFSLTSLLFFIYFRFSDRKTQ